jgi:RNA polymerase sigma-70 factor (ECF subfamily)
MPLNLVVTICPAIASFKTWLSQIVSRRIADQFRRRKRMAALEPLPNDESDEMPLVERAALESATPDAAWEVEWEQTLVSAGVERLKKQVNPEHFQIYDYHVLQGHTAAETATHLQTTQAKVYWVKHRVGAQLRHEIQRLREKLI